MSGSTRRDLALEAAVRTGLACAFLSPLVYFAVQAAAAPLYPGYAWRRQLVSELDEPGRASAGLFNAGMILSGALAVLASPALSHAMRRLPASAGWRGATALCLASSGAATLWAGLHPWPAIDHNPGPWAAGTVLFAGCYALALHRACASRALAAVFWMCWALALTVAGLRSAGLFADTAGTAQRAAALAAYAPIALAAAHLWARRSA